MTVRDDRLALGAAAVFSVSDAAALIPRSDAVAKAWLRRRGLIRVDPELGEVVVWGDVVDALRFGLEEEPVSEVPGGNFRRAGIGRRGRKR